MLLQDVPSRVWYQEQVAARNASAAAFRKRGVRRFSSRNSLSPGFPPRSPWQRGGEKRAPAVSREPRAIFISPRKWKRHRAFRAPRIEYKGTLVPLGNARTGKGDKEESDGREREDPSRRTIPERSRKLENNWTGVQRSRMAETWSEDTSIEPRVRTRESSACWSRI